MVVLLTKKEVLRRVGVTYPTIWTWMKEGLFPRSVVLQPTQKYSKVAWREEDIDEWCKARPDSKLFGGKPIPKKGEKKEGREKMG